ncbi:TPA: oligosaccharide flippase family protein [Vibrio vulnificus]|nr:oligosaccharide flippase family protein [Vibrio vulnificus]
MSVLRNSSIYLLSNVLNAAVPFMLLPVLTRTLTQSEYGQVAMFQALLTALGTVVGLNSVAAVSRKFYDKNIDSSEYEYYVSSAFHILFASLFFFAFIIYASDSYLSELLGIEKSWIYLAIIWSAFKFIVQFRLSQYQIRQNAMPYGMVQVGLTSSNLVLALLFVVILKMGANGSVIATMMSITFVSLIALRLLTKDGVLYFRDIFTIKKEKVRELIEFGVPLIPHTVGVFMLGTFDRVVINDKLGASSAGIYMVAVQISMGLMIVFDSINKAFVPWLFQTLKNDNEEIKENLVKATYLFYLILLLGIGIAYFVAPQVVVFVAGDNYIESGSIIVMLIIGQCFGGMYLSVTNYVFYVKKTGVLSLITIGSGLINLVLLYILVPEFGLQGAAVSFAFSKLIQFLVTWYLSNRCVKMPWVKVLCLR